MKRRQFIALLGGAATVTWPLTARAQQPGLPVIGFLTVASPEAWAQYVAAFKNGLSQTGFVEGQNVSIEYRWAYGDYSRLPALATGLVGLRVSVIAASGGSRSRTSSESGNIKNSDCLLVRGRRPRQAPSGGEHQSCRS